MRDSPKPLSLVLSPEHDSQKCSFELSFIFAAVSNLVLYRSEDSLSYPGRL